MGWNEAFDREENRILLGMCTRNTIRMYGIGALIWGIINLALGFAAVKEASINYILVAVSLGITITGISAVINPGLKLLFTASIVTFVLWLWNIFVLFYNYSTTGFVHFSLFGDVMTLVVAVSFFIQYKKLQFIQDIVTGITGEQFKQTKKICKALFKTKQKKFPNICAISRPRGKVELREDKAFFLEGMMLAAFLVNREELRECIDDPSAKKYTVTILHPLKKKKYLFNKKYTGKIREWLGTENSE